MNLRNFFRYVITARDIAEVPMSAKAFLTVNIIDVNDNPPVLPKNFPEILIRENVQGELVAIVKVKKEILEWV